jgi:hypothetical protein
MTLIVRFEVEARRFFMIRFNLDLKFVLLERTSNLNEAATVFSWLSFFVEGGRKRDFTDMKNTNLTVGAYTYGGV